MNKIFGLDLGTNSIGWALRNPDFTEDQIEKFGVVTFITGVGKDDKGKFTKSHAAERTKKRSVRRLYQSRKYRLWTTLKNLIQEGCCPLSIDNLNKWRHYSKEEAQKNNNGGRVYPVDDVDFDQWIKLDFNGDGIPDYTSPYQLRKELAENKIDFEEEKNRYKLGRALYHIAQRRGFKSSRKGADDTTAKEADSEEATDLQYSEKKKNKTILELFEKYPDAKTISWLFAFLENDKMRIRESIAQYAIRENYKDEIKFIFDFQGLKQEHPVYQKLVESGKNRNDGSIFYKRPLRSQKGLIGKCTLEPNKYRAPVSHPAFETFRAWSFLNNIKFKSAHNKDAYWTPLPLELKQAIFAEKFFRKSKAYFPFSEITEFIAKKGHKWELNYKPKTTVTGCPVSARLKDIFGDNYQDVKIPKAASAKASKDYYDIEDIWHVLFSYEDQEFVAEFAEQKLKLNPKQVKDFVIAWNALPVGYGMLSLNAIKKINRFLSKGLIYTEAVLLANMPEVIGKDIWESNEQFFVDHIGDIITENRRQKTILNIVNNLVSQHKNLEQKFGYKDNNYQLGESDKNDIQHAIEDAFGANRWNEKDAAEKTEIAEVVSDCYQAYFKTSGLTRKDIHGERHFEIRSGNHSYYKTDPGYYRLPKLIDNLSAFLQENFEVSEKQLGKIYHPSEISIYPPATADKDGLIKMGSPKTGSFKNPMAMRTLHELRKLMNYMIETGQIDSDTRIVVEVARDLNDANKRWAIDAWQRQREAENAEFALAIAEVSRQNGALTGIESDTDIDKMRLWYEQNDEESVPPITDLKKEVKGIRWTENKKDSYKQIAAQKQMVDKYRLWKEQECQCLYTGKIISITDLFNDNVIDFEHTIPRSISFDNSLANQTVSYADFNRNIKKNRIPFTLNNYDEILPRIAKWKEKVERIKQQIDFWNIKAKKAADKEWKDDAIRQRHLWQMELDYWKNKVDRFTMEEVTSGFKNSQKIDTQLISKYALHYLKTYFEKVDVQKGSITAEFRKIFGLQIPDEKKDRSKHSHHAKDAAVLTLIPVAAKRDEILKEYYEHKERRQSFTTEPYKGFKREFVWNIDDSILINNVTNNQSLTPAKRKVRKRGKEQLIPGTNKPMWATGDCIRGQLHQETFYGAIKPAQRDDKGTILKDEDGKMIVEDNVRYVIRVPFQYKTKPEVPGFKTLEDILKQVVDFGLKAQIEKQVKAAGGLKEAFEKGMYLLDKNGKPHGNPIRHIRVWTSGVSEPLKIKRQTNLSKAEYKQHYWAANGENIMCAFYKNDIIDKSGKVKKNRELEIINLNDAARLKSYGFTSPEGNIEVFKKDKNDEIIFDENGDKISPYAILRAGMRVIFYDNNIEEIKPIENESIRSYNSRISDRLYKVVKFAGSQVTFLHHLDSRDEKQHLAAFPEKSFFKKDEKGKEIDYGKRGKNGFTEKIEDAKQLNNGMPWHKLLYTKDWFDFAIEGKDFEVSMDGSIIW